VSGRVLHLPNRGHLIVCTDLQGCLRDFCAVVEIFHRRLAETGDAHLLFTGDLIHGPRIDPEAWPEFLGEYYSDQSGEVIDAFVALREQNPGRVHAILGNHEHGHVGGPHTAKFARDEVAVLEEELGEDRAARLRAVLAELPLVAVAPCGAVFTHGAPAAAIDDASAIEAVDLDLGGTGSPLDIFEVPVLGPLLWARSAEPEVARRFVRAMGGTISIYGHDVIPEGFERVGREQIVVSTSFGVPDSNKVYLELDLADHYQSVAELVVGSEIRPLYPDKAPNRLGGTGPG
jgi:hypothetical protein